MAEFPGEDQAVSEPQAGFGETRNGRRREQEGDGAVDVQEEKETGAGPGLLLLSAQSERLSSGLSAGQSGAELQRRTGRGGRGQQARAAGVSSRQPSAHSSPSGSVPAAEELVSRLGVLRETGGRVSGVQ